MRTIEKILSKLDSYLYTIKRDTVNGWYTLEVGLPASWTYKSTNRIECEELGGTEKMKMISIAPSEEYDGEVSIDDLIDFAIQVVSNNKKVEKMREEFEAKMLEIRKKLEEEYEKFEEELEEQIEGGLYSEDEPKPKTKKTIKRKSKPELELEEQEEDNQ